MEQFFKYDLTFNEVKDSIKTCDKKGHFQQVAYSVFGDQFTQICFACKKITISMVEA